MNRVLRPWPANRRTRDRAARCRPDCRRGSTASPPARRGAAWSSRRISPKVVGSSSAVGGNECSDRPSRVPVNTIENLPASESTRPPDNHGRPPPIGLQVGRELLDKQLVDSAVSFWPRRGTLNPHRLAHNCARKSADGARPQWPAVVGARAGDRGNRFDDVEPIHRSAAGLVEPAAGGKIPRKLDRQRIPPPNRSALIATITLACERSGTRYARSSFPPSPSATTTAPRTPEN